MKMRSLIFFAAFLFVFSAEARVHEWTWNMPGSVYRNLEFTIRSGVDRAAKVFGEAYEARRHNRLTAQQQVSRFRAAAAEWKKVQIQAESESNDSALIGYLSFMQAFSSHLARDRNQAVKSYQEAIDIYGDDRWVAVNAMYWMARARMDMGDVKVGTEVLEELIADKECEKEPVVSMALYDRACQLWSEGKNGQAIEYWERILDSYKDGISIVWNNARSRLREAYACMLDFAQMERIIFIDVADDPKSRARAILDSLAWSMQSLQHSNFALAQWFNKKYPKDKERAEKVAAFKRALMAWAVGASKIMEEGGLIWEARMAVFRMKIGTFSRSELSSSVDELVKNLRAEKDKSRRSRLANDIAIVLADNRIYDLAHNLVSLVEGPSSRSWLKYEIDRRKGDWKLAALDLEECLSQTSDPESSLRVKYTLAAIYRDNTKEYDKAIKLYTDISNPPRSLWELQIAYRAAGKKKECYRVLTELMSIFPDYGARSAYQMALYREADGEKEAAINLYKRLLRQKEWKKSPESSQAHQKLERYGIATGGAVINEVH